MKTSIALVLIASACAKQEAAENKPFPLPTASVAAATPLPSAAPAPSCSASSGPILPALKPSDMKVGPPLVPLSASASVGLWLADEGSALLSATPLATWAEGPVRIGADNTALRGVAVARLPKALRAWLGRPVKVLGASGAVCETRLQRFAIRAQITPDLRTAEHWEGCADGPPITPETIASEVWRLTANSGRSLIAEFSAPCKGALLAVDPDLPTPAIAGPRPASAEEGDAGLTALRALPEFAEIQARFQAAHPDVEGQWDDREARRSVSVLELPGHPPLTFVSVEVGSGCSGFSASLSAVSGPRARTSVVRAIDDRRVTPSAIFDVTGGDAAILLGPDGRFKARSLLRMTSTGSTRAFVGSVPFFPGPC